MPSSDRFASARRNWEGFAATDPMWAIRTSPGKRGAWDQEEFLASGERDVDALLGQVREQGISVARGRALDFGCGLGRLTLPLARRFERAVGVDVALGMVERARELAAGVGNVAYVHNAEPHLACLESSSFDFICSLITLQHVPSDAARAYIGEFVRLLAPGGVAVFQVPSSYDGPRLKRILRVLPQWLITLLWRLRYRTPYFMEMNVLPRPEVEDVVSRSGGEVLCVLTDKAAGAQWTSFKYLVGRPVS